MKEETVKICPFCKANLTLDQLVNDPLIRPIGMMFGEGNIEHAYYFFHHDTDNCGTTFIVNVLTFTPCITEPIPQEKLTLTEPCERHCVNLNDLLECKQPCFFAPYRRFLIRMIHIKGRAKPGVMVTTE